MKDAVEVHDGDAGFAAPDVKDVAAGVTVTAQISQQRSIVIQTYLPRDADVKEYHKVLDKVGKAIERQEAVAQLVEHKTNLEEEEKGLLRLQNDFLQIEERSKKEHAARGKRGTWSLSAQEIQARSAAQQNVERFKTAIEKRKAEMARLEGLISEGN